MSVDIQPEDQAVFDQLQSTGAITAQLRKLITQSHNYCSRCDQLILPGRPAFAGYDAEDKPLLACVRCAQAHLVHLATPVYPSHNLDVSIPDEVTLWRYMDFAKFSAMLMQQGLFLSRADMMEDRFEGAVGLERRQAIWDDFYLDYYRKLVAAPFPDGSLPTLSADDIESHAERLLSETKAVSAIARSRPVSCWHANPGESEAQWRLYCPPPTVGVALRSSVGRLWGAMAAEPHAVVGRVHYLDFNRAFSVTGQERIFCKRASLSHEREVRSAILDYDQTPSSGRLVPCDLEALIESVVLSPFAPAWFESVVVDTINKHGVRIPVERSELLEAPFY